MLSDKMQQAFNDQINAELYSAYLYLSMAAYLADAGLAGCERWMQTQAMEETYHGLKMYRYVTERGGRAKMQAIEGPQTEWNSPQEVFQAVLEHERKVTGLINNLVDLAVAEKDHASTNFLQWYVAEQVEEEASAEEIVNQMKLMGEAGGGLFMMDKELGQRVFNIPPEWAALVGTKA